MFCEKCGSKINDVDLTCPVCGETVKVSETPKLPEINNLKNNEADSKQCDSARKPHLPGIFVALLIFVMLCVLGAGSYFYTLHKIIDNEKLSVVKVDISSYPKIKIHLNAKGFNYNLESTSFSVKDANTYPKQINLVNESSDKYVLEYTSLNPSAKDSKVNVFIWYTDHNKSISLQTNYTIKTSKNKSKKNSSIN